jgi:2-dehydropantoate 2-reductase
LLFAWLLQRGGMEPALLDHDPDRAARLARHGFTVEHADGEERVRVPVLAPGAGLAGEPAGLTLVCVKSYDTASAVCNALPFVSGATAWVLLQNGLGNAETAARAVSPERLLCGASSVGTVRLAEDRVRHSGGLRLDLAAWDGRGAGLCRETADALARCGLATGVCGDAAALLWGKLVVSAVLNPLTAVHGVPNGALLEDPALRAEAEAAAREAGAVARASGIRLPFADAWEAVRRTCADTAGNVSSMLQDVRAGRRTEAEAITGALVRAAAAAGVPAPIHAGLLARVQALAASVATPVG